VVADDTQLIFRQTMQLIQVDTPFPHEVSQDEEEHGVFEFVLGVDLLATPGQVALKFPQLVWLLDWKGELQVSGVFRMKAGKIKGRLRPKFVKR
jgi:hypothetical protein